MAASTEYDFNDDKIAYVTMGGASLSQAEYVVIGFHGRGGNDDRMFDNLEATFADDPNVTYLAPACADGEWFDDWIVPPDNANLLESLASIDALIASLAADGIAASQIVLAGHSQGSTLVAEYVARGHSGFHNVVLMSAPYNGIGLSAGEQNLIYSKNLNNQPVRLTVHEFAPKFDVNAMEQTRVFFEARGASADLTIHPGQIHMMTEEDLVVLDSTIRSIDGTGAADRISTQGDNDLIYGFAGSDTIESWGGNDTVLGGSYNDSLDARGGNDFVYGGGGNDVLKLGPGHDHAYLGPGNDTVYGEDGNDFVSLGTGSDTAYLGGGDDILRVNIDDVAGSRNVAHGEAGFDMLQIVLDASQSRNSIVLRELRALQDFLETAGPNETYSPRAINATISGFETMDIVGPVVGVEDHGTTDEDTPLVLDVLENDRDILGDSENLRDSNDRLRIIGVDTRRIPDGASLGISSDGRSLEFDPGTAYQSLPQGASFTFRTNYTVADDQTNRVPVDFTITINGRNDAPVISPTSNNSAILSSGGPLTADGTFLVSDVDRNDVVSASVIGVTATGGGVAQNLTNAELLGFISLSPAIPVASAATEGTLGWEFDSDPADFAYLGSGKQTSIVYAVEVEDKLGATDLETVTITVRQGAVALAQTSTLGDVTGDDLASETYLSEPSSGDGFDSMF